MRRAKAEGAGDVLGAASGAAAGKAVMGGRLGGASSDYQNYENVRMVAAAGATSLIPAPPSTNGVHGSGGLREREEYLRRMRQLRAHLGASTGR